MLQDIQAAIPLGFLLSFMVGPVFFVLLQTSALKGLRAAIIFDVGVILADVIFIVVAYFSSFQLLENLSNQPGLYVFGGVILLVYGIVMMIRARKESEIPKETKKMSTSGFFNLFIKGFLLNFINVGVLVFWLGIIIIVGPSLENDSNRIVVFFTTVLIAYFITDIFKILLAKQLRKKLTKQRIFIIKRVIGFILIICGIVLVTKGFLPKDKFDIESGIERIEENISN